MTERTVLALFRKKTPDIALIDVVLPSLDGISILERLNENDLTEEIFCVILSALGSDVITKKAMSLGAKYYFLKPFNISSILDRILETYHNKKAVMRLITI